MAQRRVVLAEYFIAGETTLLFLARDDLSEPVVVEIPKTPTELRYFVAKHFGGRQAADGAVAESAGQSIYGLDEGAFHVFFEPLLRPLLETSPAGDSFVAPGDIVWIVPHDVLHYVPLHAVRIDGCHFIERNPICYSPSASVMKYCRARRKGRRETVLVLADSRADRPLFHSRLEATALTSLFGGHAQVYVGSRATKPLLMQLLADSAQEIDILHLACHGMFRADQALKSGIELAPLPNTAGFAGDDSGELTAAEIFGLDLKADLVTLSACESGINQRRPGDELIGLTRALIYAGTPSVLVSLWSVSDISTSILMTCFYKALQGGAFKAEALQAAQVAMLKMSAESAMAYCREAQRGLGDADNSSAAHRVLEEDMAEIEFRAGDYGAAAATLSRVLSGIAANSPDYRRLKGRIARCQLADSPGSNGPDYSVRIFSDLFHWAPFVLVGDWK